ncbi:kinase [Rhizobiales bacterium]|uniref:PfkB family carbohydrate kinase n=1 Tax=Hongsoonwoonella zoysiae TaxID=2821844 RepID=UPI00155FE62D|nr:PfkB family carbohydrate kinase [Hongsoonwoonella zoysiae]NRG18040.1 kinase [Hongsoonwoonella zoysiae]
MPDRKSPCKVAAFGAINLDTIIKARRAIERDTSTPSDFSEAPGGVAANVCRALSRCGVPSALAGCIGQDEAGATLKRMLAQAGVDVSGVRELDKPSGRYVALHDPDGALVAAAIDGEIVDSLPSDFFDDMRAAASSADIWFVDANLPAAVLSRLAAMTGDRLLVADAVSVAKAARLAAILPRLDMLFCNRLEAVQLMGAPPGEEAIDLAMKLARQGARACCVTDGTHPAGCCINGESFSISPLPAKVADVTGAGDALIAGWIAARLKGLDDRTALEAGLAASAITVEATGSAPAGLSWDAIEERCRNPAASARG